MFANGDDVGKLSLIVSSIATAYRVALSWANSTTPLMPSKSCHATNTKIHPQWKAPPVGWIK